MSSKYPRSVRCSLPLWALTVEAALILLFFFFTYYDASLEDQKGLLASYQVCQDLTVMAALGLGFFTSNLRRHSWSSVAFNLFMLALGVQWAILLDGFLSQFPSGKVVIKLLSIRLATRSAMSALISVSAVLGKVNLVQLVVMVLVELTVFGTVRMVIYNIFGTYMHNAALAGGVAVSASCHLIPSPWIAMVLGLVAGLISIGGAKCLPVCFNRVLGIHESHSVHYTFGLPGLLGEITYIVLMALHAVWASSNMFASKSQNMERTSCG
ncbi:PREDICTED: RH-like protein isoform X8 [Colobus angolensis palliatus]|uniref:Ammonium transporter AmtB-like domain-containing protein n=1 Tax=Colobus angolensis palliatus TaxID=336983 RepID=A0A2K5JDH9_COLAP|nr:PREDICTED: RH-like protein isoform X8 [Colobus angolensis palliatus]